MTEMPPSVPMQGLASWWDRVIAYLVDGLIILAAWVVVWILALILRPIGILIFVLGYLVLAAYGLLYLGFLEGEKGQSPGKALTGLKVVRQTDGALLGGGQGVVRRLCHIVDSLICGLGYLLPLVDPNKQTIADKIMTTVVLRDQERHPLGTEIFRA